MWKFQAFDFNQPIILQDFYILLTVLLLLMFMFMLGYDNFDFTELNLEFIVITRTLP